MGLNKLISIIDPNIVPSTRVEEKIGFIKEKEVFIFDKIHYIYSEVKEKGEEAYWTNWWLSKDQ